MWHRMYMGEEHYMVAFKGGSSDNIVVNSLDDKKINTSYQEKHHENCG